MSNPSFSNIDIAPLLSEGILVEGDICTVYVVDPSKTFHYLDVCPTIAYQGGGYVGLSSPPALTCKFCVRPDASYQVHVKDDTLRSFTKAYLLACKETSRPVRTATFSALKQLNALRSTVAPLTESSVPDRVVLPAATMRKKVFKTLEALEELETSLKLELRSWIAQDYLCNSYDVSYWPQKVVDFFEEDIPGWLHKELTQSWRGLSSRKERSRKRSTAVNVHHRLSHVSRSPAESERFRLMKATDFQEAVTLLNCALDAELERLKALEDTASFLLAKSGPIADVACRAALEAASSEPVALVNELTGLWLEVRPDLAPGVQVCKVNKDAFTSAHLEVVGTLFEPFNKNSSFATLKNVVEAAESILQKS